LPNASCKNSIWNFNNICLVQAHQDRAKDRIEQVRAVNFGRKEGFSDNEDKEREKKSYARPYQQTPQQASKHTGPVDKIIDLVSTPQEFEKSGIYRVTMESRNIQSDPSDIDDEYEIEKYQKKLEQRKYPGMEYAESESSRNANDDASNMYDDISEFERKFYREDI